MSIEAWVVSSKVCVGCFGGALSFMRYSDGRIPLFHILRRIAHVSGEGRRRKEKENESKNKRRKERYVI